MQHAPHSPQLTFRALATGVMVGTILSLCNLYAGLKTSWTLNMSIVAALVGAALWQGIAAAGLSRPWGILENNINQTTASAAAAMPSAGLVAAIPALALLTGQTLSWLQLVGWTVAISLFGVAVASLLRHQLIVVDALPFPFGVAIGETLQELYASAEEAVARFRSFLFGALCSASMVLLSKLGLLSTVRLPLHIELGPRREVSLNNLGFALDPAPLMLAVGALIGPRIGTSLIVGAALGWGIMAPAAIGAGWVETGDSSAIWYGLLNPWMVWPAVALTVSASLTAFFWTLPKTIKRLRQAQRRRSGQGNDERWLAWLMLASGMLALVAQVAFFGIHPVAALVAVVMTLLLALVAARVSGETGVSPIGSMGKITQLVFGTALPHQTAANLMAANVTAGAANQCADMMDDLKSGSMLGASPRLQALAQMVGVAAGGLVCSAAYLLLIPDPRVELMTEQWPAPAAASWKAVAELCGAGWGALPNGAAEAAVGCALLGVALAAIDKSVPPKVATWVPSAASMGLAMLIPAYYSVSAFLGGMVALGLGRFRPTWSRRFLVVVAAGIIAGESVAGFVSALSGLLGSLLG